ncbi:hypothetical protein V1503_21275 [Bacillus sp. SCS-151]|uniref:hypothetical protein n=1 Tax=Nanhaiella sioensis TaxID=3115293 RepID=UPI00397ACC0D
MVTNVYNVLLIVCCLYLVWKKDEEESYFPLKVVGYFILGSFAFSFNQITLPLGFILYILFFRPALNVEVKRMAAVFGVITFIIVHWILPYAINEWQSRPLFIEHELGSVYTINFQDEYELIKQKLELEELNLRLKNFELDYVKDGRITAFSWQFFEQKGNSYNLYNIRYDFDKVRYRITHSQLDTWVDYNRIIESAHFFENLNVLDIRDITYAKGDFSSYGIQSSGERVNYAIENRTHFIILNGEIDLLEDNQLPVEGYYFSAYALEKTGEERDAQGNITQRSYRGTQVTDYLFNVNYSER